MIKMEVLVRDTGFLKAVTFNWVFEMLTTLDVISVFSGHWFFSSFVNFLLKSSIHINCSVNFPFSYHSITDMLMMFSFVPTVFNFFFFYLNLNYSGVFCYCCCCYSEVWNFNILKTTKLVFILSAFEVEFRNVFQTLL